MMKFQFFCFGTLYHPERYPHDAETLAEDVALMRQLHMNVALISSGAVRYAMSVGGGDAWLCGILDALGGAGVSAGIEILCAAFGADPEILSGKLGFFARFYIVVDDLAEFADLVCLREREAADGNGILHFRTCVFGHKLKAAAADIRALKQFSDSVKVMAENGFSVADGKQRAVFKNQLSVAELTVGGQVKPHFVLHNFHPFSDVWV